MNRSSAIALVASAMAVPAIPAAAQSPTIRLGCTAADAFAEGFYAQDLGFFKKAGLDVEISVFSSGSALATAAAGGALDIGMSNTTTLANAFARGVPVRIFAGGGNYTSTAPTVQMLVLNSSPIRAPKDLEGRNVGILTIRDTTQLGTMAWMQKAGADPSKVHFAEMPFAPMQAALERGTVEAIVLTEPWLGNARSSPNIRLLANIYDVIAPDFWIAAWYANADYIAKNHEMFKKLLAVIDQTAVWANGHHDESSEILAKYSKQNVSTIRKSARFIYSTSRDPKYLRPVIAVMEQFNVLPKPVEAADMIAKV